MHQHQHHPNPAARAPRPWPAVTVGAVALLLAAAPVQAQSTTSPNRGQLLYATHCIACHDTQKHWRENRVVRDWDGLVGQVRHWQGVSQLQWNDADIINVARYLNARYYKLARPGIRQSQRPGPHETPG